ncbi:MAG: archease [Pirellulaceae bacterium]|jgi:SHS2 domain-containing protein|nr:protein archease [Planctomycetaceae bacterium]MDP6466188.1 archease [Pirellulaceae bacterium]MDP6554293.1 archease [Pirellulaceae bacterium]
MYEVFEHTADLGLRVRADSLDALLVDAARGLFSLIVTNLDQVKAVQEKTIRIDASEPEYLLFDWLNELLYTFDVDQLLFSEFIVRVDARGLTATCRGEPMQPGRHEMDHEVKAITYHGLKVQKEEKGWMAELIVDI